MSETTIQNPNINTKSPNRLVMYGATVLAIAGLGMGIKKFGAGNADPFATTIPVPAESQPHQDYIVQPGDTESSIAAHFGQANNPDYQNMINAQLPSEDQPNRILRPGEALRLPK